MHISDREIDEAINTVRTPRRVELIDDAHVWQTSSGAVYLAAHVAIGASRRFIILRKRPRDRWHVLLLLGRRRDIEALAGVADGVLDAIDAARADHDEARDG